ncbi:hypothetical protein HT031_004539 [Scenedesmus sp. PABB004]|nr:hypothetical protein HT031_004539 [Scenedesmus sp. PABB004]
MRSSGARSRAAGSMYARLGGDAAAAAPLPPARLAGLYALSLLVFVLLDGAWISAATAAGVYAPLAPLLRPAPDLAAAALSWCCIVGANLAFVLPRTAGRAVSGAVAQGALLGVLLYGTVDLTNTALLTGWSWRVSAVDIAWGTCACAALAVVQQRLAAWLGGGGGRD